ncbi:MAG: twin-arginine translocase subunit TatC [Tannerellaceae bacterium]
MQAEEMTFWDHLEELRWTIFRVILALFVFAIAGFSFMPTIFNNVVMAPCSGDFITYREMCNFSVWMGTSLQHLFNLAEPLYLLPDFCNQEFHVDIINIKLASQFFTHMTTSFWFALLLCFPYLIYEVWRFISPALYDNEKRGVKWVFTFGTLMFFVGCAVGYLLVFPMTLRFLATYELSSAISNQISLDSYMNNFYMLVFVMGIVFELPLVSWLLSQIGLLDRSFFSQYRRYAIVALLVAAAFITPSSDPFTLSIVFLPLYLLYEVSALFVNKKKVEDDSEEDSLDLVNN